MGTVKWRGPKKGFHSVESKVAHLGGVVDSVKAHGNSMGHHAETTLMVHRDTGDTKIEVRHQGVTELDSSVVLTSSDGKRSAYSIEFGHDILNKNGEVVGHVPGIGALMGALRAEKSKARYS